MEAEETVVTPLGAGRVDAASGEINYDAWDQQIISYLVRLEKGNTGAIISPLVHLFNQALGWIAADGDQGLTERGPSALQRQAMTQHIVRSYSFTRLLNHAPRVMCYIESVVRSNLHHSIFCGLNLHIV
jgi:hypothetical protein